MFKRKKLAKLFLPPLSSNKSPFHAKSARLIKSLCRGKNQVLALPWVLSQGVLLATTWDKVQVVLRTPCSEYSVALSWATKSKDLQTQKFAKCKIVLSKLSTKTAPWLTT